MRLIRITKDASGNVRPDLVDFSPDRIPRYAILSHRWGAAVEEVLFGDIRPYGELQMRDTMKAIQTKIGFRKLQYSCVQALADGLDYLWIDTCCIDKSSSAELSEAINSMYTWYSNATICYAYLDDVSSDYDEKDFSTLWTTRGWTLQELLAPTDVIFYSEDWTRIGTKESLSSVLSRVTGIDVEFLTRKKPLEAASIAKRMSWAAQRKTTRPEDMAYCLMGIFSVNMPMLYGEGNRAFLRLQEEIMRNSDDHSLFAWIDEDVSEDSYHGLLAKHPSKFKHSNSIIPYQDREVREPFSISNRGLRIELHLSFLKDNTTYAAALDCPVPPHFEDSSFLTIFLKRVPGADGQFARVKAGRFGEIHERGVLSQIYVRQNITAPDAEGIYPSHVFQLRRFDANDRGYRITKVLRPPRMPSTPPINSSKTTYNWTPLGGTQTCKIVNKGEQGISCALSVVWNEEEEFLILLGSVAGNQVGFCVFEPKGHKINTAVLPVLGHFYVPKPMGSRIVLGYHAVQLTTEVFVVGSAKYYMVDIRLEALERPPPDLLDVVIDTVEDIISPGSHPNHKEGGRFKKLYRGFGRS